MQLDRSVADRKFAAENWSINWKLARVGMEYCTRTWFVFWLKDSKGKVFGAVRMPNLLQPKFSKNIWRGDGIRCNPKADFLHWGISTNETRSAKISHSMEGVICVPLFIYWTGILLHDSEVHPPTWASELWYVLSRKGQSQWHSRKLTYFPGHQPDRTHLRIKSNCVQKHVVPH